MAEHVHGCTAATRCSAEKICTAWSSAAALLGVVDLTAELRSEHPHALSLALLAAHAAEAELRASAAAGKRGTLTSAALARGKSPNIVFADADLEVAVPGAANAIFFNHGQCCCAGSRLYVEQSVYDDVLSGVADRAATIEVGRGLEPETEMGPLVSSEQLERVTGYLASGEREGVRTSSAGSGSASGATSSPRPCSTVRTRATRSSTRRSSARS